MVNNAVHVQNAWNDHGVLMAWPHDCGFAQMHVDNSDDNCLNTRLVKTETQTQGLSHAKAKYSK